MGTLKGNAERKKAILQMTDVAKGIDDRQHGKTNEIFTNYKNPKHN